MSENILLKIKAIYKNLNPVEKAIANYIIKNSNKLCDHTIDEISKEIGCANSTFFKFTKKLGYSGFTDFKYSYKLQEKQENSILVYDNIKEEDTDITIAKKVFDSTIKSLEDTKSFLSEKNISEAVNIIKKSYKVYLFGVGGSEIVASDAYHKFLRSPISIHHNTDYHVQLMEAAVLNKKDCGIIISHSGNTIECINIAKILKSNGCKVITITGQQNSPITEYADVILTSISDETKYRPESLASRIAQLCILDTLYAILISQSNCKFEKPISKIRRAMSNYTKLN